MKVKNLSKLVDLGYIENYDYYDKSVYINGRYVGEIRIDFMGNINPIVINESKMVVDAIVNEVRKLGGLVEND